jgi:uncharacterized coiled-coil protein SlyX
MKQQMMEHKNIIESHHKEMQTLRDELRLAQERFDSLSDRNVQDLKDFKTYSVCTMGVLNQRVISNEGLTAEQWRTIHDLNEQLQSFQVIFASKIDIEKAKRSMEGLVKESTTSHLNAFQDFQRETKILISALKEEIDKLRFEMEQKMATFMDKIESHLYISRIDKDGVLNEIRVYKMDMFVIEKKIENIYTLIERINKRGNTCPAL